MFTILLVLALVGFSISLVLHVRAILYLSPEPEQPGCAPDLTFRWLGIHFVLMIANGLVLILEQFWNERNFIQFWQNIWVFLPPWAKWAIGFFIVYLISLVVVETNRFRIRPGKYRICKQGGKYWIQQVYFVQRMDEGSPVLEEISLAQKEISRRQYLREIGYASSLFPFVWAFNCFCLALYFWYKSQ
jgi:hypothetical protein